MITLVAMITLAGALSLIVMVCSIDKGNLVAILSCIVLVILVTALEQVNEVVEKQRQERLNQTYCNEYWIEEE